jgi:alpha-glucosidase (family GH31 glycosyl hydrolase)
MYARWVQLGTFQPVDRLHSNHSDRLPWQYGAAARAFADKFLNLRENLVPHTYSLAQQADTTGGTTQNITSGLDTMPVFVRAGAAIPTRMSNVTSNDKAPLTKVTLTVAAGASGSTSLYEDNGTTTKAGQSATTKIRYQETGSRHTVTISPTAGAFPGQVQNRQWTISLLSATAPNSVTAGKAQLSRDDYHFDSATRTLTVTLPRHSVHTPISFTYS